jgi:hypothetical protein
MYSLMPYSAGKRRWAARATIRDVRGTETSRWIHHERLRALSSQRGQRALELFGLMGQRSTLSRRAAASMTSTDVDGPGMAGSRGRQSGWPPGRPPSVAPSTCRAVPDPGSSISRLSRASGHLGVFCLKELQPLPCRAAWRVSYTGSKAWNASSFRRALWPTRSPWSSGWAESQGHKRLEHSSVGAVSPAKRTVVTQNE